ncbi:glutamic acid-rich protein isoform X1 [Bactrocera neohumeralis]|uniref:glutamic acid-rich protein isoform X1 n=1 Tax=Bactrocera neohumeralis TaxID=98809 RepID=UPI002166AA79|nr:glutamic acid-rich protein isoform X1 [Bactrocera neohumeralis]
MHKAKKKTKTGKIPKPIKVKKEKTEEDRTLHPMSHYIDDRLELVKQIFGSLKPKTITNLAPDFLKKQSMDEIEELCLNELLGISTKRLLSIINATKCPSDTESSGDSDVEHQEEHISLEEISSDSEIEGTSSNAGKKKSNASDAKNNTKKSTKNPAEKDENNGQISVLELLELQARARAIRSQLALEPVTKIEVDSDPEKGDGKKGALKSTNGTTPKEHKRKRRRKSSEKSKDAEKSQTSSSKASKETTRADIKTASKSNVKIMSKEDEAQTTKPTKMKRNYRISNQEPESGVSESENKSKNKESVTAAKDVKAETRSRSPTPDVIPIIPEPETLFISDSSDGEHNEKDKKKATQVECAKSGSANGTEDKVANTTSRERKLTEPEEGELIESQTENDQQDDHMEVNEPNVGPSATENTESATNPQTINEVTAETNKSQNPSVVEVAEKIDVSADTATEANISTTNTALPKKEEENLAPSLEDEDDGNDDVISLEGGDLEEEMIEHLEEDTNTKSSFATSPNKASTANEEQDADVISLDSSEEDERDKTSSESWHSRYLKSSKVSKVLATSRLGKRVRDNIKKSKRSKKDTERVKVAEEKEKPSPSYASKHEDGSIEQYKELLAMRQRKK